MIRLIILFTLLVGCGGNEVELSLSSPEPYVDAGLASDAGSLHDTYSDVTVDNDPSVDVPDLSLPDLPVLVDDLTSSPDWKSSVELAIDHSALSAYFSDVGYTLPSGSAVYVARIVDGSGFPGYQLFDAGGGAFDMSFWPASTIKLLSALAALEWVYAQGFTGAARVDWDSGFGDVLRSIYRRSIRVSSNIDYDRTLRAAGWDFMNAEFLTPERGFPRTVITGSYARVEVRNPGGYTLSENGESKYIPGRAGVGEYGRNDVDLYELTEGLRRIMLDDEIPEEERFRIAPADVTEVQAALCSATPSYFEASAVAVLGAGTTVCHKPGWVPDNECLDHALITGPNGDRFLVAASVPYATNCPSLSPIARHSLEFLKRPNTRVPLQPDSADFPVQVDPGTITVQLNADEVVVWIDGNEVGRVTDNDRGHFVIPHTSSGEHFVAVAGYVNGERTMFRSGTTTL